MDVGVLLSLQSRAAAAADEAELTFLMANETWHLLPYRQAYVFLNDAIGKPQLTCITGLASLQGHTPFTLWLQRLVKALDLDLNGEPQVLSINSIDGELAEAWHEWWPECAMLVPLKRAGGSRAGEGLGFVIYVREERWQENDGQMFNLVHQSYAQALVALRGGSPSLLHRLGHEIKHRRVVQVVIAALLIISFIPIRLSALAPAEIIPLQAEIIAAPLDGVVSEFFVKPNALVAEGDALFSLDDTTLRSRRAVAMEALEVARADVLTAQQKAFDSIDSKAELAVLQGRRREKESELAFIEDQLAKTVIKARRAGIFVYTNEDDWLGRPVATGERVGQLAQPEGLGVEVWLPVNDAINLNTGAEMQVYLQVAPLSPLSGELVQTSYQASVSPEGVAAYRVRGALQGDDREARIGLRGVAKLYGETRPLIYAAFRRPMGAVRQWLGV